VDNSAASGSTVGAIFMAVDAAAPLSDAVDADVGSVSGGVIDVGNRFVPNGQLDIVSGRVWALLFTVRMQ
jgi:hypothetical protein